MFSFSGSLEYSGEAAVTQEPGDKQWGITDAQIASMQEEQSSIERYSFSIVAAGAANCSGEMYRKRGGAFG
jgi:hypothetical protein